MKGLSWYLKVWQELDLFASLPRRALVVAALVGLASFGVEITNQSLSIDDEVAIHDEVISTLWIARGRWGLFALVRLLYPYPVVPNGPLLLSVLLIALAAVLLCKQWGIERDLDIAAVASVMVSFPVLSHILQFSVMSAGIGPGFLAVALATWLVGSRVTLVKLLGISALIVVALSFYQVFVVVALSAFMVKLALSLRQPADIKGLLKWTLLCVICTTIGYLLHSLVTRLLVGVLRIPADPYISELHSLPANWIEALARVQQSAALTQRILLGSSEVFGIHIQALPVLLLLSVVATIAAALFTKRLHISTFLMISLIVAVLAMNILAGIGSKYIATRLMMGLVLVVGAFSAFAINFFKSSVSFRSVIIALLALTSIQFVQSNNRLLSSAKLAYEIDQHMAYQLALEIQRAELRAGLQAKYLEVSGYWRPDSTPAIARTEVIGASFFEWDGGSPYRIGFFLNANGFRLLRPAPFEERIKAVFASLSMPTWPEDGSVAVVGEVAVIKFGPLSSQQRGWIMDVCTRGLLRDELEEFTPLCK